MSKQFYRIYLMYDDVNRADLYEPDRDDLTLIRPELVMDVSSAGTLKFTMPPGHIFYDEIRLLSSTIAVWEDRSWPTDEVEPTGDEDVLPENDALIWVGRPVRISVDYLKRKTVECEGGIAFLSDSIQEAHDYGATTTTHILETLLAVHNTQVGADRQILPGAVTVADSNITLETDYESTLELLRKFSSDDQYGGWLRLRQDPEDYNWYLDWLASYTDSAEQEVQYGLNLLDLKQNYSGETLATRVIPLGKDGLTIAGVNSGSTSLTDATAAAQYGTITRVLEYDDCANASTVKALGQAWLNAQGPLSLEVNAADLYIVAGKVKPFRLGDLVRVRSEPHGVNTVLPITRMVVQLESGRKKVTLGVSGQKSLTQLNRSSRGSGGGGSPPSPTPTPTPTPTPGPAPSMLDDVRFLDYDGQLLYSYSAADFANLSAFPTNPSHTGLTAQGWNWTLSDAKAYVASYGALDIGQMYVTSDGRTRIYIKLEEGRLEPYLHLAINGTATVDWGDGSATDTMTGSSTSTLAEVHHTYAAAGDYAISVAVTGSMAILGWATVLSGRRARVMLSAFPLSADEYESGQCYPNAIRRVEIGNNCNVGDYAFNACPNLSSVVVARGVTSVGQYAFRSCCGLRCVVLPDTVTRLSDSLFDYGTNITPISFISVPGSITEIGKRTFYNCAGLSRIAIPNTVTSVGASAFYGCSALARVDIPGSISSGTATMFYNCLGIVRAVVHSGVTQIGASMFQDCYGLVSVEIPSGVTTIGSQAFYECLGLINISLPDSVTSIGSYAFRRCESLTSLSIPSGVTSIGVYAFYGCRALTGIELPSGVTSIEGYTFASCYALTSVSLPSGLSSIGTYAFHDCRALTSIELPSGVTTIGTYAFYYCTSLTSINLPGALTSIGAYAFAKCNMLATGITIPGGVTRIEAYTFDDCNRLPGVSIHSGVTFIGDCAFSYCCALTSVTIPNSVTSLGRGAFYGCSTLAEVNLSNSLTAIANYTFYECSALASIAIPSGVTSIGEQAFSRSALRSITIPSGVTSIGASAFFLCNGLTEVHFTRATPPTCGSWAWGDLPTSCKIYVPAGSLAAYTGASNYPSSSTYTYIEE